MGCLDIFDMNKTNAIIVGKLIVYAISPLYLLHSVIAPGIHTTKSVLLKTDDYHIYRIRTEQRARSHHPSSLTSYCFKFKVSCKNNFRGFWMVCWLLPLWFMQSTAQKMNFSIKDFSSKCDQMWGALEPCEGFAKTYSQKTPSYMLGRVLEYPSVVCRI